MYAKELRSPNSASGHLTLGLVSASNAFTVLLFRILSREMNAEGLPGAPEGRNLVGPKDDEFWPLPRSLAWHREEHGFHRLQNIALGSLSGKRESKAHPRLPPGDISLSPNEGPSK